MSASATASVSLPRTLGRYTLFDKIGRGGMADIFLAREQTELGISRLVVIKQILPHLAQSQQFADLLISEAKLAARLDHANVVQVHDLGRVDGFLYIAMQYVEGFDLAELLRRCSKTKTALPVQYALLIIIEALRGLDYAHRRMTEDGRPLGIVHRDVSPSNLLISLEGEVKLCDFGIAHANDVMNTTPDDVIKGKAGYMSPEQASGDPLDARADVFAAGIVLWELLSGRRLYRLNKESGGPSLLDQARAAEIPELPSRGLPVEDKLIAIVKKALAPVRDARYASAQAMLRDLEQYVAESRLIASPIKFGEWLLERYGEEVVQQRRARALAQSNAEAQAEDAQRSSGAIQKGAAKSVSSAEPPPSSGRRARESAAPAPMVGRSASAGASAETAQGPKKPPISPMTGLLMLLVAIGLVVGILYLFATNQ